MAFNESLCGALCTPQIGQPLTANCIVYPSSRAPNATKSCLLDKKRELFGETVTYLYYDNVTIRRTPAHYPVCRQVILKHAQYIHFAHNASGSRWR